MCLKGVFGVVGRKVRFALAFSCLTVLTQISTFAGSVTLAWDASPDVSVVGYRLYFGVASGVYTNSAAVGNVTNATLTGLVNGSTYYFAATAYDSDGVESIFSNETTNTIPVVVPTNLPPTLDAIATVTLSEDAGVQTVGLSGISSGSATENQTLTVTASSSNPALIPNPAVSYASPSASGSLSFTPVANANGTATITVTVNDGQAVSNTISRAFTVTVNAVNDVPTLNALGNLTINEDAGAQTVSLSGIASGAANESQTLTVTATSSNPALIPNPTVTYTSPSATGSLAFTPVANASGTATVTVTVNDGQAVNNIMTRTFIVTVNAVNDAPTLNSLANVVLVENAAPQTVGLSGIGTGAANESDTLTVTATSSNPGLIPNPTVSYVSPNATGSILFTPVTDASGTATVTVTVNDGQAANNTVSRTFTVTVTPVNNAPTLNAIADVTIAEDAGAQTVALSGIGPGAANEVQTLTITASSSNPSLIPNPTVSYTSPNATGSLAFAPVANASGSATVTVTVNDGQTSNNIVARTFIVTVNPVNDAPTLNAIANVSVGQNSGAQTVNLSGIGSGAANENDSLSVTATSSNPSVVPNPTVGYTSPNATGSLSFTPVANATGSAIITVTVNDGQPTNNLVTRTFTVAVNLANTPPTLATIGNVTVNEDAGVQSVALSGIGTGSAAEIQTLTITAVSSNPGLIPNPVVNYTSPDAVGSLSVTPAANSNGTAVITVTVDDGHAVSNTVSRTFTVTVNAVNDVPTLNGLVDLTINEDAGVQTVALSGIGSGAANETQTLSVTATSSNPSLIPNPTVSYASPNAAGSLSFTPVANANGTATITVTVNDGQAANNTVSRSFLVTVTAVNDAPTLNSLANVSIPENAGAQTVSLSGIGSGAANESQPLTITAVSSNPSLIPNPTVSYASPNSTGSLGFTPAANSSGSATITVTVDDGQAANNTIIRTFNVAVNLANVPPTLAAIGNVMINEDAGAQSVALSGIGTGSANETQTLTVTAVSSNPSLIPDPTVTYTSPNATGTLGFTPTADANGTANITVTVNDGHAVSNTFSRTFTVTVNAVNDAPTLNALGNLTIDEDATAQTVTLVGIGTGSANETQTLTVTAVSSNPSLIPNPTVSYASPSATGSLSFTPVANASGAATITVTVNDGQAANNTVTRSFLVTVNAVNDPPTLNAIADLSLSEDAPQQTVALSGISAGPSESQTLTVTAVSSNPSLIPNPAVNYTSPNATGSLSFTPVANSNGTATVTVTINDGQAANNTVTRSFTVSVGAVNDAPTISAIANQAVTSGTTSAAIPFTVGDAETAATALTLSASSTAPAILPVSSIGFGGSGANRTVTLSPVSGQSGSLNVTITVSDGTATASRTFQVTVAQQTAQLSVTKTGMGTVTPDLTTTTLVVGQSYTVTASPATGYQFAGWSGSLSSSSPTVTFTMSTGFALQANFVADPYVAASGTYNGLFTESDEVRVSSAGAFNLYVDPAGSYSGWVQLGYSRYTLSGKLDLNLRATNVISRWNLNALTVELLVAGSQVSGRVTDGTWTAPLAGGRAAATSPFAGEYTVVMPGLVGDARIPAGDGFGTMTVGSDGLATLSGTLADGTMFSQSAYLTSDGDWPLYVSLYVGKGAVVSWMTFTNLASSDLNGSFVWIKAAGASATSYPLGFTNETKAVGSLYTKAVEPGKLLSLSAAAVSFTGGDLGAGFFNSVSFNTGSQVVNLSPNQLSFTISKSGGTFSGLVEEPGTGVSHTFNGVLLQKQNAAYGFMTGTTASSRVVLAAP